MSGSTASTVTSTSGSRATHSTSPRATGNDAGEVPDARAADATVAATGDAGDDGPGAPYKGVANSACGDLTKLGVSWVYNWGLSPDNGCTAAPFVPMVWGHTGKEQTSAGITAEVSSLVSTGYDTVLGFNEPDNSGQSNMSVDTAIALWPAFNNPAVKIGSPATQANTTGMSWFTSFMNEVNADTTGTLRVDFIAAHWYGWNSGSCDSKASTLESYLKQIEAIPGNRPIWLTEWGCLNDSNPSEAVVQAFFSGALTMLAKHPRVVRYAWYPWETNNELVGDAGLTALGEVFAAAPSTH